MAQRPLQRLFTSSPAGGRGEDEGQGPRRRAMLFAASAAAGVAAGLLLRRGGGDSAAAEQSVPGPAAGMRAGKRQGGLRDISLDEVRKRDGRGGETWVTFRDGVYDISDFVARHPGGSDKIKMAAGGSLEPFWDLYAVHLESEHVVDQLEALRIGNLRAADRAKLDAEREAARASAGTGPYADEPGRSPLFVVRSQRPFNAEPPMALLTDSFRTPNALFYVRNHLPVPRVDPATYALEIATGRDEEPTVRLTLDDLRTKFAQHSVTTTVQCAGNRREEMSQAKTVKGLVWTGAAAGTATWTGPRLVDVLAYARVSPDAWRHVQFEGLDRDESAAYGASIPASRAFQRDAEVVLALEMNGEELPRDHGFPVRAIVPGVVGARNVKWLARVVPSHEESHSHWQRKDYKGFSSSTTWDNVDWENAASIQELPVTSAICSTRRLDDESVLVSGYAYSGGGRAIVRVDISVDGGNEWLAADLLDSPSIADVDPSTRRAWAWTRFEIVLDIKAGSPVSITSRAVDASYNVQPEHVRSVWNIRGVLNNSVHTVEAPQ